MERFLEYKLRETKEYLIANSMLAGLFVAAIVMACFSGSIALILFEGFGLFWCLINIIRSQRKIKEIKHLLDKTNIHTI